MQIKKNFVTLQRKNFFVMVNKVLLPLLKNKYSFSLILFLVWVVFFDTNNLIDRAISLKQVHNLENDIFFYREKIKDDQTRLDELLSNPANLEKFAREQYLMKKDNEDVFIIDN